MLKIFSPWEEAVAAPPKPEVPERHRENILKALMAGIRVPSGPRVLQQSETDLVSRSDEQGIFGRNLFMHLGRLLKTRPQVRPG
jgi:hypothetical protein